MLRSVRRGEDSCRRLWNSSPPAACCALLPEALELLSEMQAKRVEPNVISYTSSINACVKGAQPEQGLEPLREMQAKRVEPDVISYSATIRACEKGAQPEQTLELLREMQSKSVKLNVVGYNAVIRACGKGAQPKQSLDLLREMQAKRVEPDVMSYNATISACGKGVQPAKALKLLCEMQAKHVEPNVISYSCAINARVKGAQPEQGLELLRGMQAKRVEPDVIIYKNLDESLRERRAARGGAEVAVRDAEQASSGGCHELQRDDQRLWEERATPAQALGAKRVAQALRMEHAPHAATLRRAQHRCVTSTQHRCVTSTASPLTMTPPNVCEASGYSCAAVPLAWCRSSI